MTPPPHVFGLAAGGLRYARFDRHEAGLSLLANTRATLPSEALPAGPLGMGALDGEAVGGAIRAVLAAAGGPVAEASLVLPDAWVRTTFVDAGDLPRGAEARRDVLRWKLRRSVPFRVEDLRLVARPVPPMPGQEEPRRYAVGFALESLLAALEETFAGAGVRLGAIVSESAALAATLAGTSGLSALLLVTRSDYSLLVVRGGEPCVYRHKGLDGGGEAAVERDLRLTRAFLAEQLPDDGLARVVLLAREAIDDWCDLVGRGLGRPVEPLSPSGFVAGVPGETSWRELAPLAGVAAGEVD